MRILDSLANLFKPVYFDVQLDLTNACNLRCTHCYHPHHNNLGALTTENWLRVISKIQSLADEVRGTPKFSICGGEPTLAESFVPVMDEIRRRFPAAPVFVLTNGTILNRPLPSSSGTTTALDVIRQSGTSVQVSFDGPTPELHDKVRGKGQFERALAGVRLLRSQGTPVSFQAVLSRQMAPHIREFFVVAREHGASSMDFVRLVEEGQARLDVDRAGGHLLGDDLRLAMEEILRTSAEFKIPTNNSGPLWGLISEKLGSSNRFGFCDVIIDYRGNLKVSSRTSKTIGNVLLDELSTVLFRDPTLRALRQGEIVGCSACDFFKNNRCSGDRNVAFAASGSFLGPDVGCWKWRSENGYKKEHSTMVADHRHGHNHSDGSGSEGDHVA